MTILRQFTWTLLATGVLTLTACSEEPIAPTGPPDSPTANVLTGSIDVLSPGGTSNTVMAMAVSPRGWVLGGFHSDGVTVRVQSWSPYPDYVVSTVIDGGVYPSAADEHGDVITWEPKMDRSCIWPTPRAGGAVHRCSTAAPARSRRPRKLERGGLE